MSLVIPTRLREELPQGFVYPMWPSKVTRFLEHTPQRHDAELVFTWRDELWESRWRRRIELRGSLKLVSVHYTPYWSPYFPKWKITMCSVPRRFLEGAQDLLFNGEMEALAERLKGYPLVPDQEITEEIKMDLSQY